MPPGPTLPKEDTGALRKFPSDDGDSEAWGLRWVAGRVRNDDRWLKVDERRLLSCIRTTRPKLSTRYDCNA